MGSYPGAGRRCFSLRNGSSFNREKFNFRCSSTWFTDAEDVHKCTPQLPQPPNYLGRSETVGTSAGQRRLILWRIKHLGSTGESRLGWSSSSGSGATELAGR
jgi:hypothetical protein